MEPLTHNDASVRTTVIYGTYNQSRSIPVPGLFTKKIILDVKLIQLLVYI